MRIAMIGTRGVPARYGGFETCVEEVGARLADRGHLVTVYCRSHVAEDAKLLQTYKGMRLVQLPAVKKRSLETLSHTALSVGHVFGRGTEAAIVFNSANAPLLPALRARRIPVATHVDGLEWKRAKWAGAGREYYRRAESMAVRWSDLLIADAQGISDYYTEEFGVDTVQIAYGAPILEDRKPELLADMGLEGNDYHLVVARFEPENHVDLIVDGYVQSKASKPLVVVGGAPYSDDYTSRIRSLADDRVRLVGPVWDQNVLDQLYANAMTYLHGHSVGGTNPSLLRAIGAGAATNAFDVIFNREVLDTAGCYFSTPADVTRLVEAAEDDTDTCIKRGQASLERAKLYNWDDVADKYENLARRLVTKKFPAQRASGKRQGSTIANELTGGV